MIGKRLQALFYPRVVVQRSGASRRVASIASGRDLVVCVVRVSAALHLDLQMLTSLTMATNNPSGHCFCFARSPSAPDSTCSALKVLLLYRARPLLAH